MSERPFGMAGPLLRLTGLRKEFGRPGGWFRGRNTLITAVDDVSLELKRGESFGLVGESGSGKTTLGRLVLRFERPTSGSVEFEGLDVTSMRGHEQQEYRRRVQMIFQNPFSSLNPRRSVRDTMASGYAIHRIATGDDRDRRMLELFDRVGLRGDTLDRYPHQLSGGQRQRVVIARALSVGPDLIVADEPVSALDVSITAQVLNLMKSLREDLGLTYLLITHDLRVVSFFCHRIGVMYLGRVVEVASRENVIERPLHPYTRMLIGAVPSGVPGSRGVTPFVRGEILADSETRHGCVFSNRCWLKKTLGDPPQCNTERPVLREVMPNQWAACHFAELSGEHASALTLAQVFGERSSP